MTQPTNDFSNLGLSSPILSSLKRAGFSEPTPIQQKAIPVALTGRDVIGCAATGTGKTAAFLLPLIERLAKKPGKRALILAPTRELALQIGEQAQVFGAALRMQSAVIIGGVGMDAQSKALRDGREILIATPGRLIDHLEGGMVRLGDVEILVLDEADRMLDMGFKPQLKRILGALPSQRQTLLFSATMGEEVKAFSRTHQRDPVRVEVARSGTTAARAEQQVFMVPHAHKEALLLTLLTESAESTLVFTRTKHRADKVAKSLARAGHKVARIHSNRTQGQRRQALEGFRDGNYRVLVATDIAARGIDVAEIGHVVNFDLPHVPEDYVHRIGRTARASASGRASSFAAPDEHGLLRDIERYSRSSIPRAALPEESGVFHTALQDAQNHQAEAGSGAPGRAHRPRTPPRSSGRNAKSHARRH